MKLKEGQSVKVKKGVLCPGAPEFDLSGWQGRIFDVDEDLIGISWDSITFKEMPDPYVEKSEREVLDWATMYLYASDLEPAKPRDTEADAREALRELEARFGWLSLGEEGERIQAVVNSAKSHDEREVAKAWEKHLKKTLAFPFDALVAEAQDRGPLRQGDKLRVVKMVSLDDLYGIIVSCKAKGSQYDFPLADLEAKDENSANAQPLQDYCVWFANR